MTLRVRLNLRRRTWLVWAADLLLVTGAGFLLVAGWELSKASLYQRVQQAEFDKAIDDAVAFDEARQSQPEPVSSSQPAGQPAIPSRQPVRFLNPLRLDPQIIGRLESPEINLSVMVREGIDDDTLSRAAGHLPSSALPGEPGNFVVLGHRDTFFRALRGMERGASLRVRTRSGRFTYVVDSIEVTEPDAIRLDQGREPSATLITCFPFTYIGPAPRRLVVHARLAGRDAGR